MDKKEIETMQARIKDWETLEKRERELISTRDQLASISGNFSEVRYVTITMQPRGKSALCFDGELTDYEVRAALIPLVQAKLEAVWKLKKEL